MNWNNLRVDRCRVNYKKGWFFLSVESAVGTIRFRLASSEFVELLMEMVRAKEWYEQLPDQAKDVERTFGACCCQCGTLFALSSRCPACDSDDYQCGSYPRDEFVDLKPTWDES